MFNMLRSCIDAYTKQTLSFSISKVEDHGYSSESCLVVELVLKEVGTDLDKFVEKDLQIYLNELFRHSFGDLKVQPQIGDVFTIGLTTCFWKGPPVNLETEFPELEHRLRNLVNLNYWLESLRVINSKINSFNFTQIGFIDEIPITDWLQQWLAPANCTYYIGKALANLQTNTLTITYNYKNQSSSKVKEIKSADYINSQSMKITPSAKATKNLYLLLWKGVVYTASSVGIYGVYESKDMCSSNALVDSAVTYGVNSNNQESRILYRSSWAELLKKYHVYSNNYESLGLILALASMHKSSEVLIFEKSDLQTIEQIYKIKYPVSCGHKPLPLTERPIDYFSNLVDALERDSLFAVTAIWAELLEAEAEYVAHQQLIATD